jgi:hypothetical protein
MSRLHRIPLLLLSFALLSCSPNAASCTPCTGGLTFVLDRIAGSLSRGTTTELSICVDGRCTPTKVTRDAASSSAFVKVDGLSGGGDHTITVKSTDGPTINGTYTGKIAVVDQKPGGKACTAGCKVGVVRVDDDGTPVPGVPSSPTTTAPAAGVTTTVAG